MRKVLVKNCAADAFFKKIHDDIKAQRAGDDVWDVIRAEVKKRGLATASELDKLVLGFIGPDHQELVLETEEETFEDMMADISSDDDALDAGDLPTGLAL